MGTLHLGLQLTLYFILGSILLLSPARAECNGGDSCCDGIECGVGEGDCDSDTNCKGRLKCGINNCVGESFDETDDCCFDPLPNTTNQKPYNPTTTNQKPNPGTAIDCKAMEDAQLIIRNTRIAFGCGIGNPTISLNTCSQISCLEGIIKEIGACAREAEKMDCQSLERVSTAILTVTERYCGGDVINTCMCGMKGPSLSDLRIKAPGGTVTTEHEFPWQVMISIASMGFVGGGTLITPSHVLTANHVVAGFEADPKYVEARLGSNDRSSLRAFPVKAIYGHPNYGKIGTGPVIGTTYDFAILELETPVPFSLKMSPACLPGADNTNLVDEIVIVTGWGATEWKADLVQTLLKTPYAEDPLKIMSNSDCNKLYSDMSVEISDDMICTDANNKVDSCQGDAGGPMVIVDTKTYNWTLVGVVSFGFECASDYPGVYGRVTTVMDWIKETVNLKGKDNEMFDVQCNKLN